MDKLTSAAAQLDLTMIAEVRAGLSAVQKKLPPKYFYDHRGSELFEQITHLPEYYPTRAEREILLRWMPGLMARLRPRSLAELGAGSARKSRIILDAMRAEGSAAMYLPIDVSGTFLSATARQVRSEYPGLAVRPQVADISREFLLPEGAPRPLLVAFLGSTIGNFHPAGALKLLRQIRAVLQPGDHLLLGVDLRKDPARLTAAYNDSRGLTAEFNRNVLRVLNRELGADFNPDSFEHRAFYNRTAHRIEMHLVSCCDQVVTIPAIGEIAFTAGETIRTEISCKYDRDSVTDLFSDAGLRVDAWETDSDGLFALALGSIIAG